jgi:hypothetical protein
MKSTMFQKLTFSLILVLGAAPLSIAQAKLAGDWLGTLDGNGTPLRIAWHVTVAPDGSLASTVDNLDRKIYGIKVRTTTVKGSEVTLDIADTVQVDGEDVKITGITAATLNPDGTDLTGTWTQTDPPQPPVNLVLKHVPAQAAPTAQIAGDWEGALNAGGVQLRLVLHVAAGKDGALSASLDSIDQGANGIPVSAITLKDSKLNLTVDAVHGTYEGTVSADASAIAGTWSQGTPLALNFKRAETTRAASPAPQPATASDIDGVWQGALDAGGTQLRILFKIVNTQDGLTAQMQSPDQSPVWVKASTVSRSGGAISIALNGLSIAYEGKFAGDLQSVDGSFTQAGNSLALALKRVKD